MSFPFRVDPRGGVALSSGDTDVQEAIALIVGTARGERPMRPEFGCGIHDFVFEAIDAHTVGQLEYEIRVALDRWEPRIDVLDIDFETDDADRGRIEITIGYSLRGSSDVRNLIYPFYVIPASE